MSDIIQNRSRAKLILLSSCNSGSGVDDKEDNKGLSYAFSMAGTPNIIASSWEVCDREASSFFDYFYSFLAEGDHSVKSLQKAKIKQLEEAHLPARHPYFWANWSHYGHGVSYEEKNFWKKYAGVLLTAALLSIILIYTYFVRKK